MGGTGTVVFGKNGANAVQETASSSTLTIASGITVRGSSGTLGGYYSSSAVVNQGTINADGSGGLTTPFVYDTDFSGGSTGSTAATISTSGVTNPAPEAVYQTYRLGYSFAYSLTGLTPSAAYTLRLHFADPSSTAAGQRQFDVTVNGTAALTNFDIFAAAGGPDQAVVESLPVTANAQGQLAIGFSQGTAGQALVNGIEVDSGGSIVQAINCGELAGGTITVNPPTFTNQGTIGAASGGALTVTETSWTNQGTIAADTGGVVNISGNLTLAPASQVNVEVSGTAAGDFGKIVVSGSASLNGTLNVIAGSGITLSTGAAVQVMSFASYTNNFVNVTGTSLERYTFFAETVMNEAVMLTATMNAEELAAGAIVAPTTGTAGQDVSISYTVNNLSDGAISGDWFDSLYLSQSSTLDSSAVVLDRIENTTTVPADGSYTNDVDVPLAGVVPGNYYIILFVDSRGLLPLVNRADTLEVVSSTIAVSMPSLSLGNSVNTTVSSGQDLYYSIDIPAGHDVAFTADAAAAGGAELYLSYGAAPSPSQHDEFAFNPNSENQEIDVSGATQGTYYLLVQGQAAAASGDSVTIAVNDVPFSVHAASVTKVNTGAPFTETLSGFQFSPQTTAALVGPSGSVIAAQTVTYVSRNTLYATFEVPLFDDGMYSVQVQQAGQTSTLTDVITATTQPNSAEATLAMSAPQYVSSSTIGYITVTYANDSLNDIPAPLLNVTATNALLRLPDQSSFGSNKAEFLGINTTGPAGVLPPGARGQMIIYFQVDITNPSAGISFNLYPSLDFYNIGDAGQTQFTMDWSSVESEFQPSTIPDDAWSAVWSNFLMVVGTNVAEFHDLLDIDANYLSQFGEYEYDVSNLIGFELEQANDLLPVQTLASVVDSTTPAPGIPLTFSRQYMQPISGRYQLGPLGRGWVDNWEISLSADSQGNVTVADQGQDLFFALNPDGSFQAVSGLDDKLTLSNGDYTLRESDGTTMTFNAQGDLAVMQDTNGNTITAGYTGGMLTSLTSSDGEVLRISYNSAGLIDKVTDPSGQVTTYAYDSTDQLLTTVSGPQGTNLYTYISGQDIAQQYALASITSADGTHEYFSYDAMGRLVQTSHDSDAEQIDYAYPSVGVVTITDASGDTTTELFNEFGSLVQVTDPLGNTTQEQYNANQNLTDLITPVGTTYQYSYNSAGDLVQEVNPLGETTSMTYTAQFNQLASVTDPGGNTTTYSYNADGDLVSTVYADGSATSADYNPEGLPTTTTDADGQAVSYQYNAAGQVTEEKLADGTQESFTYDSQGELASTTDSTGTTTYHYNSADELTSVTYPSGETLTYTYNSEGQRISLVDSASGFAVDYNYNAVGQLASLTDANGDSLVTYTYDVDGRLSEQANSNGTYTTYSYDADSNILELINYGPGGAIQSSFAYTYNSLNERATESTLDGTWTYSYDAAGELTSAVFASTNAAVPDQNLAYVYDAAGNRVETIINGTTTNYTTNNRNEYTAVGGTTYEYDANGNLTSEINSSGTTTFTYNSLNQLTEVVTPTDTWTYQYNALGERVSATHNGQTIVYVLDPTGQGNVVAAYNRAGQLVADYAYGLGLVSQTGPTGTDYYQFDAIGSIVGVTNNAGVLEDQYTYDPFGNLLNSSTSTSATTPFGFVGQSGALNEGASLIFMRARSYDEVLGRFLSPDPLGLGGGSANPFVYVSNSPVDLLDPSGLGPGEFVPPTGIPIQRGDGTSGYIPINTNPPPRPSQDDGIPSNIGSTIAATIITGTTQLPYNIVVNGVSWYLTLSGLYNQLRSGPVPYGTQPADS